MLRGSNGRVLKPIVKPDLGEREISFYENLLISGNPIDMEIMRYTPTYYGTREMRIFDKRKYYMRKIWSNPSDICDQGKYCF